MQVEALETRQMLTADCGLDKSLTSPSSDAAEGSAAFIAQSQDHSHYDTWSTSYGSTTDLAADLNNDGRVDAADYTLLRDADAQEAVEDELLRRHEGYWVGQTTIPGSTVPATFVNDIHVDAETGYVTVYAQTRVGDTIVSPVQVAPGETGVLPDGSTLAAHPNAVYLNGSGQELMEADGTGTWWVKHPVIAEEGYYNVEVEAAEYVEVYVEGELQEDGSIRVGGVEENTGAVGFNIREVNTDTDPDTYTITRYRPANVDPSAGPIDLTPVPDPAGTFTMERSAGVSPFDGTVYRDTEDPASSTRGQAYTELIAVTVNPAMGTVTTEVWGTQGTDTSPDAAALIDLDAAAQQLGATQVILNGPRYLLADAGTLVPGEASTQTFDGLEMLLIGSIELDLASAPTSLDSDPYVPQTVSRNTDSIYYAGSEIYQLTSPAGEVYVMQSTGTELENADLAGLGDRLTLPAGWVFEVITLEEPLRVTVSDGDTIDVLVDDLGNAYGYVGISSEPTEPIPVASLTANPNPAPTGSSITLTATPVVTAAQVVFFRESNGTPGLQNTDTPVGTDSNGADGWTASVNVGGTPGTVTYYALPVNANGPVGAPMVTTSTVQGGLETAIPNEPADQLYVTDDGVEFVRTPDEQFENLPDWPYEPKYVEIDGLRQAYIDEGPEDGPVVLLLHGQPSWSYLYRDMIPVLVDAGYRVIAMDHLGMGRSDKPTDVEYYTYDVHTDRLEQFIVELGLEDINLFAQDWGSLIGLHVAGENPDWFASIAVGNGALPVLPDGVEVFPPVENPDEIADIPSNFALIPPQQVPFYDENGQLLEPFNSAFGEDYFGNWMTYAMTAASFQPSEVVEALTWFDIPADEQAAYDAPFPSRAYMAGPRSFPSVINSVPGANDQAWAGLGAYDKPFVTIWGGNDPGNLGRPETQQQLIAHVPGADGQPHTRIPEASHFLQDDQGEEIATQLVAFYEANGIMGVDPPADSEARILSAYLGAVDVRFPQPLEDVSGSDQQRGDEGMPVVFSVQIDAATLDPEDFAVTTASGAVMTPSAVTLSPADEADELRTVLLTGQLGSADDLPVSVKIVGSIRSVDGEELNGLTAAVITNENGPSLVEARVDPGETTAGGGTTPTRIQTTWQGGLSGRFGRPIGIQQLRGIRIIDVNGEAHVPHGFEDLGDNDNHLVLIVPPGVEPAGVAVRAGTLFDPTNQPNPETAIPISGTIELEPDDNQDSRLRRFFGRPKPIERPLAELPPALRRVMVSAIADRADLRRLFTDDRARFDRDWEDRPMVGRERLRPAIVDAVFGQLRSHEEVETTRETPRDRGFYRPGLR